MIPNGVLIMVDVITIIKLPTIALSKPPPSLPGPGVFSRNIAGLSALKPLIISVIKIQDKKIRPMDIATTDASIPNRWRHKRRRYTGLVGETAELLIMHRLPDAPN